MQSIRQIHDSILHSKPFRVDFTNTTHKKAIVDALGIMRENLYALGGVGIAANQCAAILHPPQVVIVGINDASKAKYRYPDKIIPQEMVMINPDVIDYAEPYYPEKGEGCLSIKTSFRSRVLRFRVVKVQYHDEKGLFHQQVFEDFTAHIIQHEWDHLQGIVCLQKTIDELNEQQCTILLETIAATKTENQTTTVFTPKVVLDRDKNNLPIIVMSLLKKALSETHPLALAGIKAELTNRLQTLQDQKDNLK